MKFKIFHRTSIESILSQGIPEVYSDPPWRVPSTIVQQAEVNQLLEQSMCAQVGIGIAWNCTYCKVLDCITWYYMVVQCAIVHSNYGKWPLSKVSPPGSDCSWLRWLPWLCAFKLKVGRLFKKNTWNRPFLPMLLICAKSKSWLSLISTVSSGSPWNANKKDIFSLAVASLLRHYLSIVGINSRIVFGLLNFCTHVFHHYHIIPGINIDH